MAASQYGNLVSVVGVFTLTVVLYWVQKTLRLALDKNLRKIPGPLLSRFTNVPLKIAVLSGGRTKYIHSLHQQYGSIVRIAPFEVHVSDIDSARQIHRVGTQFTKSAWYQNQSPVQYDDDTCGVFGLRGLEKAKARRKLFQQAGTRAAVKEWEPIIVDIVIRAVGKIKRDASEGTADLVKWWSMMTADVLGSLAFGEPFNLVKNERKTQMMKDIETSMVFIGVRTELPWLWALVCNLPLPGIGRPQAFFERFYEYGDRAVQNTKNAVKGSARTLFSKMYPEDGSQMIPDWLIASESANIIIAGSDTTAMALTYLVYRVLKEPAIKRKLLDELATCTDHPCWEELEGKQYLNNVIQETLRLHAPVCSSLTRNAPKGGATLAGYHVPEDTVVGTQAYTYHRDPAVWPEPERYVRDTLVSLRSKGPGGTILAISTLICSNIMNRGS